jgi:hypothetical protein
MKILFERGDPWFEHHSKPFQFFSLEKNKSRLKDQPK